MKSNVALWALVITLAGVVLGASKVQAQDDYANRFKEPVIIPQAEMMSDLQLCENSVAYSLRFMRSDDAKTLHDAVWRIISDDRIDDAQKLIAMTVFHTVQEVSWRIANMGESIKTKEELENYIRQVEDKTITECEYAMNRLRFPDGKMR